MQTRPDHPSLLDAVASFLLSDVAPKLEADKAAQFRVLIAANLAGMVANEVRTQNAWLQHELARLSGLLDMHGAEGLEGLDTLERELAKRLRERTLDPKAQAAALEHLWTTAKETLEVTNPRFDLSEEPS